MRIKLNDSQMRAIAHEDDLVVNKEVWEYIEQEDVVEDGVMCEDEAGKYETHIYQRPSDKKYFRITVRYARYGYKDYGYEEYLQDCVAYEVEKKEITKTLWCSIN